MIIDFGKLGTLANPTMTKEVNVICSKKIFKARQNYFSRFKNTKRFFKKINQHKEVNNFEF